MTTSSQHTHLNHSRGHSISRATTRAMIGAAFIAVAAGQATSMGQLVRQAQQQKTQATEQDAPAQPTARGAFGTKRQPVVRTSPSRASALTRSSVPRVLPRSTAAGSADSSNASVTTKPRQGLLGTSKTTKAAAPRRGGVFGARSASPVTSVGDQGSPVEPSIVGSNVPTMVPPSNSELLGGSSGFGGESSFGGSSSSSGGGSSSVNGGVSSGVETYGGQTPSVPPAPGSSGSGGQSAGGSGSSGSTGSGSGSGGVQSFGGSQPPPPPPGGSGGGSGGGGGSSGPVEPPSGGSGGGNPGPGGGSDGSGSGGGSSGGSGSGGSGGVQSFGGGNPPPSPPPPPTEPSGGGTGSGGSGPGGPIDPPPPPPPSGGGGPVDPPPTEPSGGGGGPVDPPPPPPGGGGGGGPEEPPPPPSGEVFVHLIPGSGFAGPTAQPAAVGTPDMPGYDAKAIARWDVVPYQTFTGEFNVGVVAFHMNGIDRVDFSVNGGPWTPVYEMQLNPQTNVWEYTAKLDASDFPDGPIEVRAIAWPQGAGEPRVLGGDLDGTAAERGEHSIWLTANAGDSLPEPVRYVSPTGNDNNNGLTPATAFATTNRAAHSMTQAQGSSDGGTIYLLPGTYTLNSAAWNTNSSTMNRWMTVTAAPGFSRDEVVIAGFSGAAFNSKLVRFFNLTITGSVGTGGPLEDHMWIESCKLQGNSRINGYAGAASGWSRRYMTDTNIFDVGVGVDGLVLGRGIVIERAGGDAFSGSVLLVNCEVRDYVQPPGSHTDVWQVVSRPENVILYDVRAMIDIGEINSAIKTENGAKDIAVVGCNFVSNGFNVLYFDKQYDHLLFKSTRFTGGVYTTNRPLSHNAVFENTVFSAPLPVFPDVIIRSGQ